MTKKIDNLLKSFLIETDKEIKEETEVIWEEEPITFAEFITSKDMMNFPPYSERQLDAMNYLLGTDPKNTFNNGISFSVLVWGKGGFSKDKKVTDVKTGETHTVEEWSKLGKDIFVDAFDFHKNKKVITRIKPFFKEGKGKIYKVKLKSGKTFYVDGEHKFYTDKYVWQKVKELKKGDKVISVKEDKNV